jgi:CDP-Glycerol:Poly(glycerophosphate) glycerophosphotransferase
MGHDPSDLAFVINTAESVNHYGAIWRCLAASGDAFEVVAGGMEEPSADIRDAVVAAGAPCLTMEEALGRGRHYRTVVSHHPFMTGLLRDVAPLGDRHVRLMYGLGKAAWNFAPWNDLYEVILCFGPFQRDQLADVTGSLLVEVGYPRFDPFFQGRFDPATERARFGCDPARETLVWMPTWSDLSSTGAHAESMLALAGRWNVVLKLHPFVRFHQPDEVERLRAMPFAAVIAEPIDNVALYAMADWIVADYGGPMFGAIYTDRDLILLDVAASAGNELLGPGSPELMLRNVLPSVAEPDPDAVAAVLGDPGERRRQRDVRAALRRDLFAPFYGFAADMAAEAIRRTDEMLALPTPGRGARS